MPPLFIIDAFADAVFGGNPAAVILLDRMPATEWLQALAAEMNLSETAVVVPHTDAFALRWFTPRAEVDLCGHATLAAAHVLYSTGRLAPERPACFHTRSGDLIVVNHGREYEMDFPAVAASPSAAPGGLLAALGVAAAEVFNNRMDYLCLLPDEAAVRAVAPDMATLAGVEARGVIVTARAATPGFDFVSRFFAPRVGVPEDPVTGSAHCALAPFWAARLDKLDMTGYQASARGGVVRVGLRGERVLLRGTAVTTVAGEWTAGVTF